MDKKRRVVLFAAAASSVAAIAPVRAQQRVEEKDPQAVALGYVHDAKRVDRKKFPKFADGQVCSNCSLYQGKAGDAWGGCGIFAGKQVAGPGWCTAWAKKA